MKLTKFKLESNNATHPDIPYFSMMRQFATTFLLIFLMQKAFCQLYVEQEFHHYVVEDLDNYQETISIIGQNGSTSEESLGFLVNENAELLHYKLYERKGDLI
jgi:hypothetical protein